MILTMKYFFLRIILALLTSQVATMIYAYDFKVDNISYTKLNETKVAVAGYSGNDNEITIPKFVEYNGKKYLVSAIGKEAFYHSKISNITLPESINTIEEYAFRETAITAIDLPENVISIGHHAFLWCRKLKKINIPEGITFIGGQTFEGCAIEDINIPESVKSIDFNAFKNCKNLHTVLGMSGISSIGKEAFCGCENLKSFNIPTAAETIGEAAFKDCVSLTSIVIPPSVKTIAKYTFSGCSNLKDVTISEGVQRLELDAFYRCESLSEIFIPASLIEIYLLPFEYCSNLSSIKVSENNPKFDSRDNCNAIMSSTDDFFWGKDNLVVGCNGTIIPSSTKKIAYNNGWGAFTGCSLASVIIPRELTRLQSFRECYIGEINVEDGNTVYDSRNNCNAIVETKSNTIHTVSSKTFIPQDIVKVQGDFRPYTEMSCLYCYPSTPPELQLYWTGNGENYVYYFTDEQFQNMTLYVPKGCKSAYDQTKGWNNFWNIKEFDATGINEPFVDNCTETLYYDIRGIQIKSPRKGFNIIKKGDGTSKKVFVK